MKDESPMHPKADDSIDDVGHLIRLTGGREPVAEAQFDAAHARVTAHWQSVIAERRRERRSTRMRLIAAAASLVVVVSILTSVVIRTPAIAVASIDHVVGDVVADGKPVRPGDSIVQGSTIETGTSARVAIELVNGQSLRLDTNTRMNMRDFGRISLELGAVYVASAAAGDPSPVYVETAFGVASDIGTRFQVRVDEQRLTVGVRDGIVEFDRPDGDLVSIAGGSMYLVKETGEGREQPLDENASDWDWADSIRPPFNIDGATLTDYLLWYARERGMTLEFTNEGSERIVGSTLLAGSIEGLTLEEGLAVVQRIAPFSSESDQLVLTVGIE